MQCNVTEEIQQLQYTMDDDDFFYFPNKLIQVDLIHVHTCIYGSRTISPRTISPRTISPRTISPRTISPQDKIPPDNIPPFQYPPGQNTPRTISPRMISLVKHVLVKKKYFNSSVLNFPKTCVGKKKKYIYIYIFNSSVLNYP